jgi:hypothetical protein
MKTDHEISITIGNRAIIGKGVGVLAVTVIVLAALLAAYLVGFSIK